MLPAHPSVGTYTGGVEEIPRIAELVEKGYAREVTEPGEVKQGRTWYLPHFAVKNPNKPGKIRVVFDAAAQFRGTSLNEEPFTGPDLLTSLIGIS
jgi:hypothetical protein